MATIDEAGNSFDPNARPEGWDVTKAMARLPAFSDMAFSEAAGGVYTSMSHYIASMESIGKALQAVPSAESYLKLSLMPSSTARNVTEWPGMAPASLKKVAQENVLCNMIIQGRVLDFLRYSVLSSHPWRPGWRVEMMGGSKHPTAQDLKDIDSAAKFILDCNVETELGDTRTRDAAGLTGFQQYGSMLVRDTMRFDMMASWTQSDEDGRVVAFAALPGGNIRYAAEGGYDNNPDNFAVLVDETGQVVSVFTRKDLETTIRNPCTDPESGKYGTPEIVMTVEIIQAMQNAIRLNASTFDKSGIPNGILLLKGDMWTQRQIDLLTRAWKNMKTGISKTWSLPAMSVPGDGNIEILNLNDLKGTDVRYKEHMNMMAGIFCAVWGFPVRRLGYFASGQHKDNEPLADQSTSMVGDDDPGLAPLLIAVERHVNAILQTRWPHLCMRFTGKNPKEDAREYEERKQANTQKERRAQADLPSIESVAPDGVEFKLLAKFMDMCPTDSNQTGPFTALASIAMKKILGVEGGEEKDKGAKTGEKLDPARSEQHGGVSGVRRNSAREKGKS